MDERQDHSRPALHSISLSASRIRLLQKSLCCRQRVEAAVTEETCEIEVRFTVAAAAVDSASNAQWQQADDTVRAAGVAAQRGGPAVGADLSRRMWRTEAGDQEAPERSSTTITGQQQRIGTMHADAIGKGISMWPQDDKKKATCSSTVSATQLTHATRSDRYATHARICRALTPAATASPIPLLLSLAAS